MNNNPNPTHYRDYEDPPYDHMSSNKSEGPLDHLSDGLQGQARTAFIAKVYSLLAIQLLITFAFCLISQFSQSYRSFQLENPLLLILPIAIIIVVLIVAFCIKKAQKFPIDLTLMLLFVLSFSYIISFSCSAAVDRIDEPVVPIAIAATLAISLALTLYAFLCKGNWKLWLGILVVCSAAAFTIGISLFFTRMSGLVLLFCILGVIIYGIYLVIITKMIIGNQIEGFPLDAPIIASLLLYIYIMRIFIYILMIIRR